MTTSNWIAFPDINKRALEIVKYNLENPDIAVEAKTKAIQRVAEMRTHDNLTKADLIFALRWLFRHYDFLED